MLEKKFSETVLKTGKPACRFGGHIFPHYATYFSLRRRASGVSDLLLALMRASRLQGTAYASSGLHRAPATGHGQVR